MSTLEEMKQEATECGIKFNPNIGEEKLQAKLDEFYAKEEAVANVKPVEVKEEEEKVEIDPKKVAAKSHMEIIKAMERENKKTKVVKLTMVDKREASTATDAYFSNGNIAMRVPLDTFVEMPIILIEQAKKAKALIHKKVEDVRNSAPSYAPKYVVEYKE